MQHINVAFYLIREWVWNFPKMLKNFTIEDSVMFQFFSGHYDKFKTQRLKTQFHFNDCFFHYVNGDMAMFRRPWKDVEYIYCKMNISGNHCILLHICLTLWDKQAYDSDMPLTSDEQFEKTVELICLMLPYLRLNASFSSDQYQDLKGPKPFNYNRQPSLKVS